MDSKFSVNDKQIYLLVLKFLKERGLFKSYIALETETKTSLVSYSEELAMLRQLILEGQFEDSEAYLIPFIERFGQKINPAMYEIKKQYYLELLEIGPDYQIMTRLLKSIQQYASKDNYKRLFYLLSLENLKDHAEYQTWSPEKGRLQCFENVKNCIDEVFHFQSEEKQVSNSLTTILERLINLELKDSKKFERVLNECNSHNTNELQIIDDSIIGQSANRLKINFFEEPGTEKVPAFESHKSTNFAIQQNQQKQQGGVSKPNASAQSTIVQPVKSFQSQLQKGRFENDNNSIQSSNANSYINPSQSNYGIEQSQLQQYQNDIKKNEMDFMELNESYMEESQQTDFLEQYQNRIMQQGQNKSMLLKGQKLLVSNNNPNLEQSSYLGYIPGIQSEHMGNNQYVDSNYYCQSMPPQQQTGLKQSSYISNSNYGGGKSYVIPNSQLIEHAKKLQNQQENLINERSEEDQYTTHNQEEKEEDDEEEDQDEEVEEEEDEENDDNQENKYYQQSNNYQMQSDLKFYKNQSDLPEEQSGFQQSKGRNFYENESNMNQEEKSKKSSNKQYSSSTLNQSSANDSKLKQSQQNYNQSGVNPLKPTKDAGQSQLQQSSASQQQGKESGISLNKKSVQMSNMSSNVQHQVLDQDDFQQYPFNKEMFNQTSDLSKQNQYSQVQQPMKSKSTTNWQNNQLNANLSQSSQGSNIKNPVQKNTQNLQESEVFSYNYEELIEVCQIKDVQPIRTAQFSPDGEFFVLGTNSKSIKAFSIKEIVKNYKKVKQQKDIKRNEQCSTIWVKKNHHDGSIYTIDWSKDGQFIATGSNDMNIKVINVPQIPYDNNDREFNTITLSGHKGIVRTLRFHPNSYRIYSAGYPDTSIMIWDIEKQSLSSKLVGHTDAINSLDIDGEGNQLVSVSKDNTLRIWDLKSNKQIRSIDLDSKKYDQLNYVNLNNGFSNTNLKHLLKKSKLKIKSAANENTACVAHTNGLISIWDLNYPQKSLYEIKNHTADCRSVEFDPTGNYIISTSFDKTICIYNINEKKIFTKITNHSDRVVLSKFHPFLPFVLSTSADSTSRIFAPSEFIKTFQC